MHDNNAVSLGNGNGTTNVKISDSGDVSFFHKATGALVRFLIGSAEIFSEVSLNM